MEILKINWDKDIVEFEVEGVQYIMNHKEYLREKEYFEDLKNRWAKRQIFIGVLPVTLIDSKDVLILKKDKDGYFEGLVEVEGNIPKGKIYAPVSALDNIHIPNEAKFNYGIFKSKWFKRV